MKRFFWGRKGLKLVFALLFTLLVHLTTLQYAEAFNDTGSEDWFSGSGAGWGPLVVPDTYRPGNSADAFVKEGPWYGQQSAAPSYATIAEVKEYVAIKMNDRETPINIIYTGDSTKLGNQLKTMLEEIFAADDYLYLSISMWSYSYEGFAGSLPVTFTIDYRTTQAQEDYVDSEVSRILGELITPNLNNHQKVKKIHDYIVANTAYDTTYSRYTAYHILTDGTAVCQGYAMLAYKMLNEAGVTTRTVTGRAGGGNHAWNLVQLDGNWYHLDCTWNDPIPDVPGRVLYDYYLITDSMIAQTHTWDPGKWPAANTVYVNPGDTPGYIPVSGVTLNPDGLDLIIGDVAVLIPAIQPANATDKTITWSSSDTSVATVNSGGEVTAVGRGTAVITVKTRDGDKTATCTVTVLDRAVGDYIKWDLQTGIEPDKRWTIVFNKNLDKDTVNSQTVYVLDKNGERHLVNYEFTDARIILVPQNNYNRGGTYNLWIKDLRAYDGTALSRNVKMKFTIVND